MERMFDSETVETALRTLRRSPLFLVAAYGVAFALLCADGYVRSVLWHSIFWDAHTYAAALRKYAAGGDPYNSGAGQNLFVYPPITLLAGRWLLDLFPAGLLWFAYLSLYILSVVVLLVTIVRHYVRQRWMDISLGAVLLLGTPNLAGADAILSGNISLLCYSAAFLGAIPGIRQGRWMFLYVAVAVIATIKVTFLLLLMLPLFLGRRQLFACAGCTSIVAGVYGAQWIFARAASQQFLLALQRQAYTGFDDGYSVFHYARVLNTELHVGPAFLPFAAEVIFVAVIFVALILLRRRLLDTLDGVWLSLVLLAVVLCNPRMKVYDAAVGALPAFALLVYGLRTLPSLWIMVAVLLPAIGLTALYDLQGAEVLLWAAAFLGAYTALWQLRGSGTGQPFRGSRDS
jgi:hypothetical protein